MISPLPSQPIAIMSEPFFRTTCPSCGAPVQVYSPTAITVVCSYCSSMLVLQDNSLNDTGRDSALLQDFSPIQIGTTGTHQGQGFAVVGRLQAKYDAGVWNEWYVQFDNGENGWLAEAGDIHVITRQIATPNNAPAFNEIRAGISTLDYGKTFVASDVREITLSNAAAQGELPFRLPEHYQNRVADWRCENAFLTLDYSETPPQAFLGCTAQLNQLFLQNTRSDDQIRQSAGSLKGTRQSENCPHCGSSIHWLRGITPTVICPSCGSDLDTSEEKAKLIAANEMRQAQQENLPLPIGKTGKIHGNSYTVIGAVRYEELRPDDAHAALYGSPLSLVPVDWWREYLLYNPSRGFLWLVETSQNKWSLSETQTEFPPLGQSAIGSADDAQDRVLQGFMPKNAYKLYDYGGRVSYAAGAFYWHIRAGDITYYQDYQQGSNKLSAERTRNELAWSKSTPITRQQLATWFTFDGSNAPQYSAQMQPDPVSRQMVWLMIGVFILINIPAWLKMDSDNIEFSLVLSAVIVYILYQAGRDRSEDDDDDDD